MKAVVCRAPGELALEDRPPAGAAPESVIVAVSHVGICGTDYHIYEGLHPFLQYPRVMGHEVSGRVVSGGDATNLPPGSSVIINPYISCGRCIACRRGRPNCCTAIKVLGVHTDGAMCEAIAVPAQNVYPADGLSLADAATVEFLAIGAHAVRRSNPEPGSTALVIGAGPIGLGTALFSRLAGLDVTVLDASEERLAFASDRLGFASTILLGSDIAQRVAAATGGDGFLTVFDATGNAASMRSAFAHVAHGGILVMVSVVREDIAFSDPEFHKREMAVIGSRNATRADFETVVAAIKSGGVRPADLVTHRTSLEGVVQELPRWTHAKSGLVKALIEIS